MVYDDLRSKLQEYNWDDGFEIPEEILADPGCDLALALEVFYLGDGYAYLENLTKATDLIEWSRFITALYPRWTKGQYGFSGRLRLLAALSSLPGVSPAASSALPETKSAPEKLRRTCQREKTGAGKKEDDGGPGQHILAGSAEPRSFGARLTPTEDDDAASVDFSRWQACCPLSTEGILIY